MTHAHNLLGEPPATLLPGNPEAEGELAEGVPAAEVATTMAARGYGVWAHDNWYSLGLREKLPYPDSAIRVGLIHYNTADEIDRFNAALAAL